MSKIRKPPPVDSPPFVSQRDFELAQAAASFPGRKIICGGTIATIIGRILQRPITVDLTQVNTGMPPPAIMEGAISSPKGR